MIFLSLTIRRALTAKTENRTCLPLTPLTDSGLAPPVIIRIFLLLLDLFTVVILNNLWKQVCHLVGLGWTDARRLGGCYFLLLSDLDCGQLAQVNLSFAYFDLENRFLVP